MRGRWLLASVGVILLGVIAGALSHLRRTTTAPPHSGPGQAPTDAGTTIVEEVSLPGVVRAQHVVSVPAPIEGTLDVLFVTVGEEVFVDQLLARIENTSVAASVQAAQEEVRRAEARVNDVESLRIAARLEASRAGADLNRSRSEFQRAERAALRQQMLYREGATPRLVYEEVQGEFEIQKKEYETMQELARRADERVTSLLQDLETARRLLVAANQDLDAASLDLLATEVYCPVNGVLIGMSAVAGDEVNPAVEDLFQIAVDLLMLEVTVEPDPPSLERIRPGQPAQVYLAEVPNEAIPAVVVEVREGRVVVEFTSPGPAVMPGASAQVTIKLT